MRSGYGPAAFRPLQNPFYVALPYCDMQAGRLKPEAVSMRHVLPSWFVYSFGLIRPLVEALIGIAFVLGLFTRWALLAGSLLMSILIFGTCIRSDWVTVGIQMTYAIAYFLALLFLEHNQYSLDRALWTRKRDRLHIDRVMLFPLGFDQLFELFHRSLTGPQDDQSIFFLQHQIPSVVRVRPGRQFRIS